MIMVRLSWGKSCVQGGVVFSATSEGVLFSVCSIFSLTKSNPHAATNLNQAETANYRHCHAGIQMIKWKLPLQMQNCWPASVSHATVG